MRYDDEYDDFDNDIFEMYGIESYDEEGEEDYEAIGTFLKGEGDKGEISNEEEEE